MRKYYHGGFGKLRVGDQVRPAIETGVRSASDYGAEGVHRRDRVYLTTNPDAALIFAALSPCRCGTVYEVEPIGVLEHDPDCSELGLSYQCERAIVKSIYRKCSKKDTKRLLRAVLPL